MTALDEEIFVTRKTSASTTAVVALSILAAGWGFGLFGRDIDIESRIGMILGGSAVAVIAWRDALVRIRLGQTALVAEYVLRSRVIPYADIVDLRVEEELPLRPLGGSVATRKDVIVIHRRRGFPLVLRNFDDDIATPFGALQRHWSMAMDQAKERALSARQ